MIASITEAQHLDSSRLYRIAILIDNAAGDRSLWDKTKDDLRKLLAGRQCQGRSLSRRRKSAICLTRKPTALRPQAVAPWRKAKAEFAGSISIYTDRRS